MGHAFDSDCIVFNEKGVYDPSWIAPADMEELVARNEEINKWKFYDQTKERSCCVIMTSEKALYANIILRKGVV